MFYMVSLLIINTMMMVVASEPVLSVCPCLGPDTEMETEGKELFSRGRVSRVIRAGGIRRIRGCLGNIPRCTSILSRCPLSGTLSIRHTGACSLITELTPGSVGTPFTMVSGGTSVSGVGDLLATGRINCSTSRAGRLLVPYNTLCDSLRSLTSTRGMASIVADLSGARCTTILRSTLPRCRSAGVVLPLRSTLSGCCLNGLLHSASIPSSRGGRVLCTCIKARISMTGLGLVVETGRSNLSCSTVSPCVLSRKCRLHR